MNSTIPSSTFTNRLLIAATFWCGCIMLGLFTTSLVRIMPSIGIAGLVLTSFVYAYTHRGVPRPQFRPAYWSLMGIFGIHVVWGLLTEKANQAEFGREMVLQLPFLLLPLAFWLLPGIPSRYLRNLYLWFIGLVTVSAVGSTVYYLQHQAEIHSLYLHSKLMPTVPDHIRFSLMVTYAIVLGALLLWHEAVSQQLRPVLMVVVSFLVVYQHILAVRSGLMTLYALGGLTVLALLVGPKRYRLAGLLLGLVLLLPAVSYVALPTFHNKFLNTQEDVGKVEQSGSANNYSLVGRVYSYKAAVQIVKEHPWLGVGRANIQPAMAAQYHRYFPQIEASSYILPHNQFLFYLVSFGVIGVVLFVVLLYLPGVRVWPRPAPLLVSMYLILTLSFLVEYPLEIQIGLNFSLLFLLLALSGQVRPNTPEEGWRPA